MLGYFVEKTFQVASRLKKPVDNPLEVQQKVLSKLVDTARYTDFGRHYNFDALLSSNDLISSFQNAVPVFDYDKIFDEWWCKLLDCQADVTWPGRIKRFALSSGTSGAASKYIPVSSEMKKSMRKAGLRTFMSLINFNLPPNLYTKAMLMIGGTTSLIDKYDYKMGDLSGINGDAPPFWIRGYYKPGTEIAKTRDWHERTKIIAQNAPKWDVGYITGIPSWCQLTLQAIIDYHKLKNIHELWPNLSVFVSGGINYKPYESTFNNLFGKDVTIIDSYLASEGFIAFQTRPETKSMRLVVDNGIFFEFIPFDDNNFDDAGNPKPQLEVYHINEVEEGKDYAILLSTNAGAWRYLIGDVIRFTDLKYLEINITGRTKHFLSVCGEHLSVDNMNAGIIHLQNSFKIRINEFTVSAIKSGDSFYHHWYIGLNETIDPQQLSQTLDQKLCELNDDYQTERKANVLGPIKIDIIPSKWFYNYLEKTGKMTGQTKFPRVLKNENWKNWVDFVNDQKKLVQIC